MRIFIRTLLICLLYTSDAADEGLGDCLLSRGLGDVYKRQIYKNSIDQVREQISRTPKPLPELVMPTINSIDDLKNFGIEEFALKNYDPHPPIKAKMAI